MCLVNECAQLRKDLNDVRMEIEERSTETEFPKDLEDEIAVTNNKGGRSVTFMMKTRKQGRSADTLMRMGDIEMLI